MPRSRLLDELGKSQGHLSRCRVPCFLGERRVAREVGECGRLDAGRGSRANARQLEGGLDVRELVLGRERLLMTTVEPSEEVLTGTTGANANLSERSLDRLVVFQAPLSEGLLDHCMCEVRFVLGHPPRAVAPDARHLEHVPLTHPRTQEHGE